MSIQEQAVALLEAQQAKVKPRSPQWMVGEQLKDICRQEPRSAELITQDLQVEAMSITEAEKKIKAYADSHKTGNFACVTPVEAENILREFYGLPRPDEVTPERGRGIAGTTSSCVNLFCVKGFATVGTYHLDGRARPILQRLIDPARLIN